MSSVVVWLISANASMHLMALTSSLLTLFGAKNAWKSRSHMLHVGIRGVHLEIVLNRKTTISPYSTNDNHLGSHTRGDLPCSREWLLPEEVREEKPVTNTDREKSATQQSKILSELLFPRGY